MATTVAEQLASLKEGAASRLPADVLEIFHTDEAALDAAGIPSAVATAGTPMPDGNLLDAHGVATSLAATRDGKPAVVVFYRGAWCPYCNLTLKAYQEQLVGELTARGVSLIAVSPQRPDGTLSMQETNALSYHVLSDPGNQLAGALGILTKPGEGRGHRRRCRDPQLDRRTPQIHDPHRAGRNPAGTAGVAPTARDARARPWPAKAEAETR